jgi:hypothetical protein
MCLAVALPIDDLPETLVRMHERRIAAREPAGRREVRFWFRDPQPALPVWADCQLLVLPWGNRAAASRLPRTGWCRREDLESGLWQHLHPEPVDIPAALGLEKGVWFLIPEGGLRGVLVRDERGRPHVYMITQPATHYYEIMTRNNRMPLFAGRQM